MSVFRPLFYKISSSRIVTVKQVLESYDGLGMLRTLDPKEGLVVVLCSEDMVCHAQAVMEELEAEPMPDPDLPYEHIVGIKTFR